LATEFNADEAQLRDRISRNDWFDVEPVMSQTDLVTRVWADEIAKAASEHIADSRWEAFALAGIQQYANASSLSEVKIANLVKQAGYSQSTFFRLFDNLTKYQLRLYQLVSQLSAEVYAQKLFAKPRPPLEFAEFTINLFYSADCTIPNDWVATLWRKYGHLGHESFHPQMMHISRTMARYIEQHKALGYNELAVSEVHAVVCLYERELLESRLGATPSFPQVRQARRWKDMLFGFVADKDFLDRRALTGKPGASFLKYYSS
jgi:AraC-like DNA-binding protein